MKTFQKIALVSAIAAAPFAAQAGLVSLEEAEMSNVTGQAGVTVEIDLGNDGIKVGSVVYTDTATATDTDGGSVKLENIGINLTGTLVQTIDVDANGDLKMSMSSPGDLTITMGENGVAADAGKYSALSLIGAGANNESEIINNLDLALSLGTSTTTIMNLGGTSQVLVAVPAAADRTGLITDVSDPSFDQTLVDAADAADAANAVAVATNTQIAGLAQAGLGMLSNAGVTGSYANNVSSMAIKMNTSLEITDMNLGMFGYTDAQALALASGATAKASASYEAGYTAAASVSAASATAYAAAYGAASGDTSGDGVLSAAEVTAQEAIVQNALATGSAIQVSGVTVSGTGGGAFDMNQTIWAVGGNAKLPGSTAGVYIQMGAMNLDVNVAGIAIGGSSIGQLAINGLELAGMTQRIYGH